MAGIFWILTYWLGVELMCPNPLLISMSCTEAGQIYLCLYQCWVLLNFYIIFKLKKKKKVNLPKPSWVKVKSLLKYTGRRWQQSLSENHSSNSEPKCNFYLWYKGSKVRITNKLIWSLKQQPRDPVSPWESFTHPTLMMYKQSPHLYPSPSHKRATREKPVRSLCMLLQIECTQQIASCHKNGS